MKIERLELGSFVCVYVTFCSFFLRTHLFLSLPPLHFKDHKHFSSFARKQKTNVCVHFHFPRPWKAKKAFSLIYCFVVNKNPLKPNDDVRRCSRIHLMFSRASLKLKQLLTQTKSLKFHLRDHFLIEEQ